MRFLACILTAFLGAHAAPLLRTIDSTGAVGMDTSLQVFGQADGRYAGGIQRTTGPPFSTTPFNPSAVQQASVGTATFDFRTSPATFTYTVGSVTQTRPMQRFSFASPASVCR